MIAHYGYQDASGSYYIQIDTDCCIACEAERACVAACPQQIFEIVCDDYDDEVAWVRTELRQKLVNLCSVCKATASKASAHALPCLAACTPKALAHSW